jgi:voltage-gated potassium channel Kch
MACLHYTVVTQVTVGYGNVIVQTFLGRIVSISFILIGVTSTSLLLIFFMRLMEQTSQEE